MRYISNDAVVCFRTVGLSLTLQCNFRCAHCITESSPENRQKLFRNDAEMLVREIAAESPAICFTGGESFLTKDTLLSCLELARRSGVISTLVTNAFWATSDARAREILLELMSAGLQGICISLDRFHLDYVSPQNAIRVAAISKEIGLSHAIRVCRTKRDSFATKLLATYKSSEFHFQIVKVLRLGRARGLSVNSFNETRSIPRARCSTVLSPIVQPDGSVQACCGPGIHFSRENPLHLGNWRKEPLSKILRRARSDAFIMALSNQGPAGLIKMIDGDGMAEYFPRRRKTFTGICELCLDICNNPHLVHSIEKHFALKTVQSKLIAGQACQQSLSYLQRLGFLELPQ